MKLKAIVIYYSVVNGGDGSAYPAFYLTDEMAEAYQENMTEGWGESCTGLVETYEGSNVHEEAKTNEIELKRQLDAGEDIY